MDTLKFSLKCAMLSLPSGFRKHRRSSRDHDTVLPPHAKARLHAIFRDVEKEFEALYIENVQLRDRVSVLEKANQVRPFVDSV